MPAEATPAGCRVRLAVRGYRSATSTHETISSSIEPPLLLSGAVEAIIDNGGVLRRDIQLQVKLLRNQNRDALRDQTLVKANDR